METSRAASWESALSSSEVEEPELLEQSGPGIPSTSELFALSGQGGGRTLQVLPNGQLFPRLQL